MRGSGTNCDCERVQVLSIVELFRHKTKSTDRFEHLIRPNIDPMYRFAFRLCGSRDGAEELVQSFLARLHTKVDQLEEIDKLTPWLCRGLYNLYVDGFRRQSLENDLFCYDQAIDESSDDTDTTFIEATHSELSSRLRKALQGLNDDQRIVVMLHHAEGYTLEELSTILDVPLGTLKSRLHRALGELKKSFSMEPFDEAGRVDAIGRNLS